MISCFSLMNVVPSRLLAICSGQRPARVREMVPFDCKYKSPSLRCCKLGTLVVTRLLRSDYKPTSLELIPFGTMFIATAGPSNTLERIQLRRLMRVDFELVLRRPIETAPFIRTWVRKVY
jgi:hypothetical protein